MRWRNGVQISILGEKRFVGLTNEGAQRAVIAQICDVKRGVLSVKKVTNSGNRIDQDESYIENKRSGEGTPLKEIGGMCELSLWIHGNRTRRESVNSLLCRHSESETPRG